MMPRSNRRCFRSSTALDLCHPERSLAIREANRQTKSKDPLSAHIAAGNARVSSVRQDNAVTARDDDFIEKA